jgi:hypothetical protein
MLLRAFGSRIVSIVYQSQVHKSNVRVIGLRGLCFALLPPDRFLGNLQSALLEQGATHTAAIDRHQPGPDFAYEEEQCNKENT